MDISVISGMGTTLLAKANETSFFEWWFKTVTRGPVFFLNFGSIILWVVIGAVMAKKAREVGLDKNLIFCLCVFLHFIGLIISIVLINKRKINIYQRSNPMNNMQQPYGQPQQPFYPNSNYYGQQPNNWQQPNYGQPQQGYNKQFNYYNGVNPQQHDHVDIYCPFCGTAQKDGVFCRTCGTRIR